MVEESDDLSAWAPISAPIAGDGTEKTFEVPLDTERRLFWRVSVTK